MIHADGSLKMLIIRPMVQFIALIDEYVVLLVFDEAANLAPTVRFLAYNIFSTTLISHVLELGVFALTGRCHEVMPLLCQNDCCIACRLLPVPFQS